MGRTRLLLGMLLGILTALTAWGEEPPTRPMLRVESGTHTAMIKRMAVDREERWVVTASDDKTARVWELASGRLLTTLHPPAGEDGDEGKLYAVALSPDGTTVATGGWTGYAWDRNPSIYLFDRASGALRRTLPGLPNVINHLTFSPNGDRLAATLGGNNGLRVYDTRTWDTLYTDPAYGDQSYWADFDQKGRLVTSSYDGQVRLYNAAGERLAQVTPPGGTRPYGVAFSPDGTQVAVGFEDTPAVALLSGQDLAPLPSPDVTGAKVDLSKVAWSQDGQHLLAGGGYKRDGKNSIRIWAQGGRGRFQDLPVSDNALTQLLPLGDGRVLFAAADPAWGVLHPKEGRIAPSVPPAQADLRGNGDQLRIDREAQRLRFGMEQWGQRPRLFDLEQGTLTPADDTPDKGLTPPHLEAPGLKITDWEDTPTPKRNGHPLPLEPLEWSRALAIHPQGTGFLLGAEWSLRYFDKKGRELWQKPVPSVVWAVNIAPNGRVAVAGYGDGTLRWHRLTDGQELLALFVHGDGTRWIAWTPQGYYQASPGGEELIGWHVNQGADEAAEFYPASRFRERFSRPDVVGRVLETLDEAQALALADKERGAKPTPTVRLEEILPPRLQLLAPAEGASFSTPTVTLRYRVEGRSDAPLTGLKALVDGRPVEGQGKFQPVRPGAEGTLTLPLPEQDVDVSLIGRNKHGMGEPATVRLLWRGAEKPAAGRGKGTPPAGRGFVPKPTLYLLAVGVNDYQNADIPNLAFPNKDADDFAKVMKKQHGRLYHEVHAKILPNATRAEVLEGMEWLEQETTQKDVAMLFLAGHGKNDSNGTYYFVPSDAHPEKLKSTGVGYLQIKETLTENIPGKVLLFTDTCHSGNVMGQRGGVNLDQIVNDLIAAENGVVVFAASTGKQSSLERPDWNNGAFTKALVEGLGGQAPRSNDGGITLLGLGHYLSERVKALTNKKQTPTYRLPKTISDFPIAVAPPP